MFGCHRIYSDNGEVKVVYKMWSADSEWLPKSGPLDIYKRTAAGKQTFPSGLPGLVQPDWQRKNNIESIKTNINKIKACLTEAQQQWWQSFFGEIWNPIQASVWLKNLLQSKSAVMPTCQESLPDESPLDHLIAAERSCPEVNCISSYLKGKRSYFGYFIAQQT